MMMGPTMADAPEIDIRVETISVSTCTRKLKARWSVDAQQDIQAYHGLWGGWTVVILEDEDGMAVPTPI